MGSLLSAMSNDDEERAALSSARGIGSGIGNMLPMVIVPALVKLYGENNVTGYAIGATICAVIGFVMCLLHYYLTEERNAESLEVKEVETSLSESKDNLSKMSTEIKDVNETFSST